ncbi:probable transcriptional regulator [Lachnospiraceae bacterium KM106-2]|nr:probable transcriptional regulator [Lachnospiraceae bacterium KM106-2]
MFEVGELVVYGSAGVCEVTDISTLDLDDVDEEKLYYFLLPLNTNSSKIFTPLENRKIIMRQLITKEEAMDLLENIPELEMFDTRNNKLRETQYKDAYRSCECKEWLKVIKTIHTRNQKRVAQGKKITSMDERFLKKVEDALYQEFSIVLEKTREEIEAMICEGLDVVTLSN